MAHQHVTIYTDGGARGNPGPAALGAVIRDGEHIVAAIGEYLGETTNNQAEYRAVLRALEEAKRLGATHVSLFVDSELIAKQLTREYRVKNAELSKLFVQVWNIAQSFTSFRVQHVPREQNRDADRLVNQAIDAALSR